MYNEIRVSKHPFIVLPDVVLGQRVVGEEEDYLKLPRILFLTHQFQWL